VDVDEQILQPDARSGEMTKVGSYINAVAAICLTSGFSELDALSRPPMLAISNHMAGWRLGIYSEGHAAIARGDALA
jgi:hypothetical protein